MKDNNLLLNSDIDSEFLTLISKENESFKVVGKKEYLKQSVRQWEVGILLFLVLMVGSQFGIKFIKSFGASSVIILYMQQRRLSFEKSCLKKAKAFAKNSKLEFTINLLKGP